MREQIKKIAQEILQETTPCPPVAGTAKEVSSEEVKKSLNISELKKAMLNAKEKDEITIFTKDGVYNITRTEAMPKSFFIYTN